MEKEFVTFITRHWAGIIALSSIFIEIVPIRINPISALLSYIGSRINRDLNDKIELLYNKIDDNEVDRIRWEILSFANVCREDQHHHSKDEFNHIIELNKKYHNILNQRGQSNGQIDIEYEFIIQLYKKLYGIV